MHVFENCVTSFANAPLLATWAVVGQVFIEIIGREVENPRCLLAHAKEACALRSFIYMISVIFNAFLISSDDYRFLGGSGVAASCFVIAIQDLGTRGLLGLGLLNADSIRGLPATTAQPVYIASTILRTMTYQRIIPEASARVDNKGQPRLSLMVMCVTGLFLAYIDPVCKSHLSVALFGPYTSVYSWWSGQLTIASIDHKPRPSTTPFRSLSLRQPPLPTSSRNSKRRALQRTVRLEI